MLVVVVAATSAPASVPWRGFTSLALPKCDQGLTPWFNTDTASVPWRGFTSLAPRREDTPIANAFVGFSDVTSFSPLAGIHLIGTFMGSSAVTKADIGFSPLAGIHLIGTLLAALFVLSSASAFAGFSPLAGIHLIGTVLRWGEHAQLQYDEVELQSPGGDSPHWHLGAAGIGGWYHNTHPRVLQSPGGDSPHWHARPSQPHARGFLCTESRKLQSPGGDSPHWHCPWWPG
jgi:hypothetical protein